MKKCAWIVAACIAAACSVDMPAGETRHDRQTIELEGPTQTRVSLEMGAGELVVAGGAAQLMEADFAYSPERLKPVVAQHATGSGREIEVSQPSAFGSWFGNSTSRWDLRFNDGVPIDLSAKLGAGEADLNLGGLSLRSLEVEMGAGEVRVDLRGKPTGSYSVRLRGGVGEARVQLPGTVGISATAAGGLGAVTVDGLERRGDRWINPGHENDAVQITVDVKGGIGEIRVSAE